MQSREPFARQYHHRPSHPQATRPETISEDAGHHDPAKGMQPAHHSMGGAMPPPTHIHITSATDRSIFIQTLVNCIDNSGAAIVECVNVLRSKRPAKVGA